MNLKINSIPTAALTALLGACAADSAGESSPMAARAALQADSTQPGAAVERRLAAMGTALTLRAGGEDRATALGASERALRAIESTELALSTWDSASELSRLNATPVGEWCELSPSTAATLRSVLSMRADLDGAFSPTCGALVAAWDLRGTGRTPSEVELRSAVEASAAANFQVDPTSARARRLDSGLQLDAGAFGKGAGLDAALATRESNNALFIDLGGQVAHCGSKSSPSVDLAHPLERQVPVLEVALVRTSLATTGNSERAVAPDMGHVIDPRNGRMATDFGSLSVLADSALLADALSTGLFVLGPDEAVARANADERFDVIALETTTDGRLRARCSDAIRPHLRVLDPSIVTLETDTRPRP